MRQQTTTIALLATLLLGLTFTSNAQTTAFNYQGRLTDGGNPANGNFQMQFKLFDALAAGSQIGSTLNDVPVTVSTGTFSVKLDFGAPPFSAGANRWLEIAVRRNSGESYVTLAPREQITSSPYAIRTLSAAMADDAQKLGGVNAADYVTTTNGGTSFIRNQTTQQAASNFNISGNGVVGGNVGVGTDAPTSKLDVRGNLTLEAGTSPTLYTGTGGGELNRYLNLINSFTAPSASGLKAGGLLVSDSYGFANPGKNDLIVKGNVGIGTASPSSRLTVSAFEYGISHVDGGVNLSTYINSSGGWLGTRSNHPLHFYTNDSIQRMTLSTAGQLGIGTTAPLPGYLFHVAGPMRSDSNLSTHSVVRTTGGTNSWARFYMQSTNRSWFIGTSQNFNGDQLYIGEEGVGTKLAIQPGSGPIFMHANVAQTDGNLGLPKAMVFVLANGTIARCYNGLTGSSSGGCGFTATYFGNGLYNVNFGFNVASRFYSLTSSAVGGIFAITGRLGFPANANIIEAAFWRTHDLSSVPSDFTLIVY